MKSGNFGTVTTGNGIAFGALQALVSDSVIAAPTAIGRNAEVAEAAENAEIAARARILEILPLLRIELTEKAARDVSDDRHAAVSRFVHDDARVPVHARDAFAVRRLVGIERHRHA